MVRTQGPSLSFSFVLVALTVSSSSMHHWEIGLSCGRRPGQLGNLVLVHTRGCLVLMLPTLLQDKGPWAPL